MCDAAVEARREIARIDPQATMPTYEYRCENGHEFDAFQRMSDDPLSECPECGAPAERLLSPGAGLLFKGSGFYITDYRNDDYKKKASGDKGGAAKKDSASSSTESGSAGSSTSGTSSGSSTSGGSSSSTGSE